jgi:hypothetical protein
MDPKKERVRTGRTQIVSRIIQDILAMQRGEWDARDRVDRHFEPFLKTLTTKRSGDPEEQKELYERAKEGLHKAVMKFTPDMTVDKFKVMALDDIEKSMNKGNDKGFFKKLFGQ